MIYVTERPLRSEGDEVVVSAEVRMEGAATDFGFRIRGVEAVAPPADWMVPAMLLPAMRSRQSLHVQGALSRRLHGNLENIVHAYAAWEREHHRVAVHADRVVTAHCGGTGVGCMMSGGVDGFYALYRNLDEITHVIHVRGFDLDVADARGEEHAARLEQVATQLGKRFICVTSNLWRFARIPWWFQRRPQGEQFPLHDMSPWWLYHGGALLSAGLALAPVISRLYVANTCEYDVWHPWGSDAVVDPLWSTEALDISHSGAEADRTEKIDFLLSHPQGHHLWPALRVCPNNTRGFINCGDCEKCTRTRISLSLAGGLQQWPSGGKPLSWHRVLRVPVYADNQHPWLALYRHAQQRQAPRWLRSALGVNVLQAEARKLLKSLRTLGVELSEVVSSRRDVSKM